MDTLIIEFFKVFLACESLMLITFTGLTEQVIASLKEH